MAPLFRFANPIRIDKQTLIGYTCGAKTYVHWSVFAIAALILAGVLRQPVISLLGLIAYFAVLAIHEAGHVVAAQRLGCNVESIQLYPIYGVTRFTTPWSRLDHCIIAWGGVVAQALVAIPLIGFVKIFGYTRFEALNMLFGILGFFSAAVAVFNLLPVPPLDGAIAWKIIPAFFRQESQTSRYRRR